ncbi:ribosome silencing factor [Sorangium sp. So ce590]|uniref:ribosome silencing factor n=1 Tax=unclassified Sorangium TaxID=2621164 RepID=UPI003F5DBB18
MATKKDAGKANSKPRAKSGSKADESAEPRPPARKKASTAKAGAAGRASSTAKTKRPASPRIRASHAGVGDAAAKKAARARRAAGAGDEVEPLERRARPIPADRPATRARPIPADRPATRARRPARDEGDAPRPARGGEGGAKAMLPLAGRSPARGKSPLAGPKRSGPRRSAPPPAPEPSAAARELALALAAAGLDKKAIGVEILEVVGRVDYADYLVIMTGRSDRHVHAIATGLEEAVRKEKLAPLSMEGLAAATWVLIDFGDVVVHVFQEETRRLYDIEGLWIDAGRVPVPEESLPPGAQPAPRFDPD